MLLDLLGDAALIASSAYLFGRNKYITQCVHHPTRPRNFLTLVAIFSILSIIGTYHGIPVEDALANTRLPAGAYYVVASYSHAADGEALGGVLHHTDATYVGMIGSRSKRASFARHAARAGVDPARLVCPIAATAPRRCRRSAATCS